MNNTKEQILTQSLKLFSMFGYRSVSVRDIASKLGITQAALYKHYKNKQDILDSIINRMQEDDEQRAKQYDMPETEYSKNSEKYTSTGLETLIEFTKAQFEYWTENEFAFNFRKMLTIEQFTDKKMAQLYKNYVSTGIIDYVNDLFSELIKKGELTGDAKVLAIEFFAPVYMLIDMYDKKNKNQLKTLLNEHLNKFKGEKV